MIKIYISFIVLFLIILMFSCGHEIVGPENTYPNPLDSNFTFTWDFYYRNDEEIKKNWIKDIELGNQNELWIATYLNGIVKKDGSSEIEINSLNSELPCDTIWDLASDTYNNLWIGTGNGLAKYDGENWLNFNKNNSPLPVKHISSIKIDHNDLKWIGCGNADEGGLLCYNDNTWEIYTPDNSILPTGIIDKIFIDQHNVKWIGTGWGIGGSGLIKIENNIWTLFDQNNSGLPYSSVQCIASDKNNNMWFGMSAMIFFKPGVFYGSLVKYDGKNWDEHKPIKSGKTSNRVTALAIDNYGYVWVATLMDQYYNYELSIYDGNKWIVLSSLDDSFPASHISNLKVDNENNIWLASSEGVIKIKPQY